jgi:thiamine kinase-like enzyme
MAVEPSILAAAGEAPVTQEPVPEAAGAERLTAVLRRCGVLGDGRVCGVEAETLPTLISRVSRLRLTYDGAVDAPGSVILKAGIRGRSGGLWEPGKLEVQFYGQVASAMSTPLVPRCFEAVWDAATKEWHLLFEDLSESHVIPTTWPLPPTMAQCEQILRALARFHAEWWDHPRLGVSVGTWPTDDAMKQQLQMGAEHFRSFVDRLGDRLARERRNLYERFLDAAPRLRARVRAQPNLTVVHGDAHVWNFFVPQAGGDDVRIFDWDSWRPGLAANDLAYMMAMHWYPERRRRMERPLLDHYHAVLLEHGVRHYGRRALDDDYRLAVLLQIMVPVWQTAFDLPPLIWWGHLERLVLAVDDLGCRELLG